jgi:hypothetical protein
LHTYAPIARRVAQTPGEIRDISAKMRDALQQFVSRCVFFATFPTLSAIGAHLFLRQEIFARAFAIFF